jgi:hypothetical protein
MGLSCNKEKGEQCFWLYVPNDTVLRNMKDHEFLDIFYRLMNEECVIPKELMNKLFPHNKFVRMKRMHYIHNLGINTVEFWLKFYLPRMIEGEYVPNMTEKIKSIILESRRRTLIHYGQLHSVGN